MALLVLAMLVIIGLGVAVVGVVAVPAHRDGRDVLTVKGEGVARSAQRRALSLGRGARTHAS
ncbi:MAG: hypothetical protein ABI336_13790 [Humibacillus sp.]